MPGVDWLSVELPVLVGQGAFGFYIYDDREPTPDGRRVSAWEDELLGGKDSFTGIGIDAGVRLAAKIPGAPWVQPYLGVHYFMLPGFDTIVRSSYDGLSVAAGVQLGMF